MQHFVAQGLYLNFFFASSLFLISLTYSCIWPCLSFYICLSPGVSADESLFPPIHFKYVLCAMKPDISILIDMWYRCMGAFELVRIGKSVNNEQINTSYIYSTVHLMYIKPQCQLEWFCERWGYKCMSCVFTCNGVSVLHLQKCFKLKYMCRFYTFKPVFVQGWFEEQVSRHD